MSMAFSADSRSISLYGIDNYLRIWDRTCGWELTNVPIHFDSNVAFCDEYLVYRPDGTLVVCQCNGSSLTRWDIRTARGTTFSLPSGEWLYSTIGMTEGFGVSTDGFRLSVWRLIDAHCCASFPISGVAPRGATVAITPDGLVMAGCFSEPTGSFGGSRWRDDSLKVWNAKTAREYLLSTGPNVLNVAIAPDGRAVAISREARKRTTWSAELFGDSGNLGRSEAMAREVVVLDVTDDKELGRFAGARFGKFSPDGKSFAVAMEDGAVVLYDWPLHRPWAIILWSATLYSVIVYLNCRTIKRLARG
jgi:WD40 repeat protein